MKKPVLNIADARVDSLSHGEYFECTMTEVAADLGAKDIGANVTRVPPGKAAFPLHHHSAIEEHFFVLSGTGVLRVGADTYPVKPQDYIVNLPGKAETAHQLVNTGSEDLVYLAISNMQIPDIVGYPESRKTNVCYRRTAENFERFLMLDESRDEAEYWDREDGKDVAAVVAASKAKE